MTTTASRVERDLDEIRRLAAEGAALVGEEGTGAGPDAYEQRVETARKAVRWAAETFGEDLTVASSMGDEVLLHLVGTTVPGTDVFFLDTGYHFAETLGTRDAYAAMLPIRMRTVLPLQTVAQQDAEYGPKLHDRNPDQCCALRKVEPLERALSTHRAWVTGMRREDAPTRTDIAVVGVDERRGMVKINADRRLDRGGRRALHAGERGLREPAAANRIRLHRVRAVHPRRRRRRRPSRGPLVGPRQDRMRAAHMTALVDRPVASHIPLSLDHLDHLEAEAIHIFREVAGEFERPVVLFSGGKDSVVMLHLAVKAFAPAAPPFALLHVDTGHNFPEVLDYRDETVARLGLRLVVANVQDYIDDGRLRERPDGTRNPLQTVPLLDAIEADKFDAVFGGGRRDEEKARAKERVFSLRDAFGAWDPRRQRPELWDLYNGRHAPGEHVRVFPLSNWTELDVWRYIERERIVLPDLYYAHEREVFSRDGMWLTAGEWGGPKPHETVETRTVRYRTVGDMSCTGAVESDARSTADVIIELAASRLTERGATRADDRMSEAAMEDRKKQGYF